MTPQQLKNAILQQAIQGKLVEQRAEEGTGQELFEAIQEEKKNLIEEGKLKKQKALPEITADEIPFEIPETWKWVRLGEIVTVYGGKRIPVGKKLSLTKTEHVYIRVSDMKDGFVSTDNLQYISDDIYEKISNYIIKKEDVYITVAGTIGRVGKIPYELDGANLTENADRLVFSAIKQDWLIKTLQSNLVQQQIISATTKVGQPKLAINRIQTILIPLPPLAEQQRIVEKIEELLPLVERYEKAWTRLEELNKKFPLDMQKAILGQAIQGKLAEQRAEEGTGQELFEAIQDEKKKLIEEGKLKKQKALPEITEEEIPFEIPESWKWVRLGEILYKLTDGAHSTPKYTDYGIPFISVKDLSSGHLDFTSCRFITKEEHKVLYNRCNPEYGDILLTKVGTTGIPVIVDTDMEFSLFVSVALLKFNQKKISNIFLKYLINSPLVQIQAKENTRGVGNKNWVMRDISNTLIPLPPLAEQKRIVEKIEELLPLVEKLK